MFRGAFLLALVLGCHKPADDCERAFARLARITTSKGGRPLSATVTQGLLEDCRTGKYAAYDPVLRCAMDSSTDEAAAACIDRGIKDVLRPSTGEGGSGLNPLFQE